MSVGPSVRPSVGPSVGLSVRPSPVIFRRVLGASCAVYPALFPKLVRKWMNRMNAGNILLFVIWSHFRVYEFGISYLVPLV